MSVRVELDQLRAEVHRFGALPYLLTVGGDGRPHATSVHASWEGERLAVRAGRRSLANAGERPDVTLLWAPVEPGGHSLIVDGAAAVEGDRVLVGPTSAILHRTAAAGPDEPAASDCVRLEG
ncbi:MAG TPA: hypothetical protein VFH45_09275 [Acidimicrobiales bacterium]|nr:hypothetical protein [Acidimicrobiales bacterium]